jgi:hypothetical protein
MHKVLITGASGSLKVNYAKSSLKTDFEVYGLDNLIICNIKNLNPSYHDFLILIKRSG